MLVYSSKLIGTAVLSVQSGAPVGYVSKIIVNPDNLTVVALILDGPLLARSTANLLDISSIREYSTYGIVIDTIDELVEPDEIIRLNDIIKLNFNLINLKVETKKGSKLGKVVDYTITNDNFDIKQLIVRRPIIKSLIDPELTIPKSEVVEVNDYKIIVKDEEDTIKTKASKEEFVPNFVNPFRNSKQDFAPADNQTPADKDTK